MQYKLDGTKVHQNQTPFLDSCIDMILTEPRQAIEVSGLSLAQQLLINV